MTVSEIITMEQRRNKIVQMSIFLPPLHLEAWIFYYFMDLISIFLTTISLCPQSPAPSKIDVLMINLHDSSTSQGQPTKPRALKRETDTLFIPWRKLRVSTSTLRLSSEPPPLWDGFGECSPHKVANLIDDRGQGDILSGILEQCSLSVLCIWLVSNISILEDKYVRITLVVGISNLYNKHRKNKIF